MFKFIQICVVSLFLIACASSKKDNSSIQTYKTDSGLEYQDLTIGSGKQPKNGDKVSINLKITDKLGNILEDSFTSKKPVQFTIGKEEVIKGLEEGVKSMQIGGRRKLTVPPELGFADRTTRNVPSSSILIIEVELLDIK